MTDSLRSLVLLNGDGPVDDFAFLSPMLARNRLIVGEAAVPERVCAIGYANGAQSAVHAAEGTSDALLVLVDPRGFPEKAHAIAVPTLIIAAIEQSESARVILSRMLNARLALIAAGQPLLQHRPAQVLSLIEQFLDDPTRFAAGTELLESHP